MFVIPAHSWKLLLGTLSLQVRQIVFLILVECLCVTAIQESVDNTGTCTLVLLGNEDATCCSHSD